jgi:hypothetical protein
MDPDKQIISLSASDLGLDKAYYNKSIVTANYTRAIAQMFYVLDSGKPIDDEPIPAARNDSFYSKANRIVNFEKLVSDNTPEPEIATKIEVK